MGGHSQILTMNSLDWQGLAFANIIEFQRCFRVNIRTYWDRRSYKYKVKYGFSNFCDSVKLIQSLYFLVFRLSEPFFPTNSTQALK